MSWVSVWKGAVDADWIDELGHVGFLHHQRIADIAALDIWRRAKGESQPAVEFVMTETHVRYIRELHLGMAVEVASALLAHDSKRFQLLHQIRSGDDIMCTVETLNLCFDTQQRKAVDFSAEIAASFKAWPSPPEDARPMLSIKRKADW